MNMYYLTVRRTVFEPRFGLIYGKMWATHWLKISVYFLRNINNYFTYLKINFCDSVLIYPKTELYNDF